MLIDSDSRNVNGPLGDVLRVVHGVTLQTLVEAGADETEAETIATRIGPRVEENLIQSGLVSRQIWEDEQRWEDEPA